MTQQVPQIEENLSDVKAQGSGMMHFASLLLLTESFMGGPATKKKQVKSIYQDLEVSDEDGCLSSEEESTVAGASSVDVDDCAPSCASFSDTEEVSENEQHDESEQQSKALIPVNEINTDGFYLIGRRIVGVLAALDDASSEDEMCGEDLSAFDDDASDDEKIDVGNGRRLGRGSL